MLQICYFYILCLYTILIHYTSLDEGAYFSSLPDTFIQSVSQTTFYTKICRLIIRDK